MAQAVVSLNDLNEISASITRILPILVGVHRVSLYRWDAEREFFITTHEFGFAEREDEELALTKKEIKPGSFPLLDFAREQNYMITHPLAPDADPVSWLEI